MAHILQMVALFGRAVGDTGSGVDCVAWIAQMAASFGELHRARTSCDEEYPGV